MKEVLDLINARLNRIESKVDDLSKKVYFIWGSASVIAVVVTALTNYLLK